MFPVIKNILSETIVDVCSARLAPDQLTFPRQLFGETQPLYSFNPYVLLAYPATPASKIS